MANSQIINLDWIDGLKTLESESVQCCVTSPPYWGLRDYGVSGQLGLEKTPEEYVVKMVAGFREVKRVLRNDGTLWLNLADSYAGGGRGFGYGGKQDTNKGCEDMPRSVVPTGLKAKDLCGIPWRVAFALQSDGWYLRQDIIWSKPNPMPESVTDRCTKSHEYIFLLTKSARYYYDNEAIMGKTKPETIYKIQKDILLRNERNGNLARKASYDNLTKDNGTGINSGKYLESILATALKGVNKRSVWEINVVANSEAHFATFPQEIPRTCILAGSKKGDTILDPFCGSGTTGEVALKLDRNFIGIELNEKYVTDLIIPRLDNVDPLFRVMA